MSNFIVLIPLGGLGQRFSDVGHQVPKPLVKALGKPILYWLLRSLTLKNVSKVLIPFHPDLERHRLQDQLVKDFPDVPFDFVRLETNTLGAADTVRIALEHIQKDPQQDDCPVISLDGDNFYTLDIVSLWNGENKIATFEDTGNEPIYSYVKLGGANILQIKEKEKIGSLACTGAYGFASWKNLLGMCVKALADPIHMQKSEYYISSVLALMIEEGHAFTPLVIPRDSYVCLGTPLQLRAFCNAVPRSNAYNGEVLIKPRRYCFDLDNTLVTFPRVPGDYTSVEPIPYMIDFLRYLKRFDHTIIIYTARRMGTHKGNAAAAMADIGKVTFDTLEEFQIPYDEIVFGKPVADCYIDDLGSSAFGDVEKVLGFYPTDVKPRSFNQMTNPSPLPLVRKTSSDRGLAGEIYFYNHIPLSVKDCFPIMVSHDDDECWYEVELINGATASHLFLSQELTPMSLKAIMGTLHRVHSAETPETFEIDVYANYAKKVQKRFISYSGYAKFEKSEATFDTLMKNLKEYEASGRAKQVVVHGDAVFTNILINKFGKVKLIDMRGQLGDTLTIRGDEAYDWAKLYQSLIGYDEVMQQRPVPESYRMALIEVFWETLTYLCPDIAKDDIRMLAQSLLFSLIPLHNRENETEKQTEYYKLINKCTY